MVNCACEYAMPLALVAFFRESGSRPYCSFALTEQALDVAGKLSHRAGGQGEDQREQLALPQQEYPAPGLQALLLFSPEPN